jgi:hypothetical protein
VHILRINDDLLYILNMETWKIKVAGWEAKTPKSHSRLTPNEA